jgi:hypothetical protein
MVWLCGVCNYCCDIIIIVVKNLSEERSNCIVIASLFVYYNFDKQQHKTLRIITAMAAGLIKRLISIEDIANLVEIEAPKTRGTYKKNEVMK